MRAWLTPSILYPPETLSHNHCMKAYKHKTGIFPSKLPFLYYVSLYLQIEMHMNSNFIWDWQHPVFNHMATQFFFFWFSLYNYLCWIGSPSMCFQFNSLIMDALWSNLYCKVNSFYSTLQVMIWTKNLLFRKKSYS